MGLTDRRALTVSAQNVLAMSRVPDFIEPLFKQIAESGLRISLPFAAVERRLCRRSPSMNARRNAWPSAAVGDSPASTTRSKYSIAKCSPETTVGGSFCPSSRRASPSPLRPARSVDGRRSSPRDVRQLVDASARCHDGEAPPNQRQQVVGIEDGSPRHRGQNSSSRDRCVWQILDVLPHTIGEPLITQSVEAGVNPPA